MIDLILWANTKATFAQFARNNPPANPLQYSGGMQPVYEEQPVLDGNGNPTFEEVPLYDEWGNQVYQSVPVLDGNGDPVLDADGDPTFELVPVTQTVPITEQVEVGQEEVWLDRPGFTWVWWAGSGKLMTQAGTYDQDGNELTPPTYLNGFVALCRIHGKFFEDNRLVPDDADPDKLEQWARNRVAQYIKNNGVPGTMGGIPYYEVDGVRMFRPDDVNTYLAANNLPRHEWQGGNSF